MRFLIRWAINAIALWVAIQLLPGLTHEGSAISLLVIALIFGLVNALVRPLLVMLTCPLIVLTLGLFVLVINTLMLALTEWLSGLWNLGFNSTDWGATFLGALIISVVSGVLSLLLRDEGSK